MPEQVRTFWPLYLAKKTEGNAFKEDIYFIGGFTDICPEMVEIWILDFQIFWGPKL